MTASKRKSIGRNKVDKVLSSHHDSSSSSTEEVSIGPEINTSISKKTNKPLMEKRRRARINESLALLKELVVVEADNPSKLEKADILELTVKRVRELQDLQATAQNAFQRGFQRCLGTATGFLESSGRRDLSSRLTSHIQSGSESVPQPLDMDNPLPLPPSPPTESHELLNEPINLSLLGSNVYRDCGVWRPW